jgi:DNA polymerase-3 subunit epsilon
VLLSTDLIAYYRQLSTQMFTVVDVETTGHRAYKSRVMELSVLQATLSDGILHQETHLINPQMSIPPKISQVTGISEPMVETAPLAAEVFPDYLAWLSEGILTAHNIDFDYPFLQAEYKRLGIPFSRPKPERLCTVILSRLMLADLPSRSLPDLVRHFQFDVGVSHRAEADVQACWFLTNYLLTEIQTQPDDTLIARFSQQWLVLREAAKLLGCSQKQCRRLLTQAGAQPRNAGSQRTGPLMYRRGDIEALYYERQGGHQLSLGEMDMLGFPVSPMQT